MALPPYIETAFGAVICRGKSALLTKFYGYMEVVDSTLWMLLIQEDLSEKF
jgi:hypothetical protein